MYRKENNKTATSMFRGRPLQGKIYKDANFYLMKEDVETRNLVFWCCGCVDEHGDWVVPAPTPSEDTED